MKRPSFKDVLRLLRGTPGDPESAELWLAFNAAEKVFRCCRAVRTLKDRGLGEMWVFWDDKKKKVADINYCPECGRKL